MRSNDGKKSIGVDHLTFKGCGWFWKKKQAFTWSLLAPTKFMFSTTAEKKTFTHVQWAEKRACCTEKKNIISCIHVARRKQIPSAWKLVNGLQKSCLHQIRHPLGGQMADPSEMGSKSTPRHGEYFSDNESYVIHAQRVVKTKWNSHLNPKQNSQNLSGTPLQMFVLEKLSTSSILLRANFYQLDVSIESTKQISQGLKVLSWRVRFILDKHEIINQWNLTKMWTKWKLLDSF